MEFADNPNFRTYPFEPLEEYAIIHCWVDDDWVVLQSSLSPQDNRKILNQTDFRKYIVYGPLTLRGRELYVRVVLKSPLAKLVGITAVHWPGVRRPMYTG